MTTISTDIPYPGKPSRQKKLGEREKAIFKQWRRGGTCRSIGKQFDLSHEQVRQIIMRCMYEQGRK